MTRTTRELDDVIDLTDRSHPTDQIDERGTGTGTGNGLGDRDGGGPPPTATDRPGRPRRTGRWLLAGGLVLLVLGATALTGRALTCEGSLPGCARAGYVKHIESRLVEPELHEDAWPGRQGVPQLQEQARPEGNEAGGSERDLVVVSPPSRFDFFGIQYVPESDYGTVSDLGTDAVLVDFPHDGSPEEWITMLDTAQASDLRVVAWLWPNGWAWDGGADRWNLDDQAVAFLHTVADHPALLAVYGTHEAYWNECFDCGYTTAQLQQLYRRIKAVEEVPIYSAFSGFAFWQEMGPETTFADGICDYCDTWYYPVLADGAFDRDEYIRRLDEEITTFRRLAPNSKFVWVLQSFGSREWDRSLPTPEHLADMAELASQADIDGVWWYPWTFDSETYEDVLSDSPHLHPVVAGSAGLFGRQAGHPAGADE